jgi:cupin fold WbuC family metalloprotein
MKKIDLRLVNKVCEEAKVSPRKRKNFNFHPVLEDPLQRMLNAMEPGTYVHPHKHENPDKTEAFLILRGRVLVIEFYDDGGIKDCSFLSSESGNYGVEIPPRSFHTLLSLEPGTIIYEVKNGPYDPIDDKNFAPWAPREDDPARGSYMTELLNRVKKEQCSRLPGQNPANP